VCEEGRQRRELDFVRLRKLARIEGWIVPSHYQKSISRAIEDIYRQVMGVGREREGCVVADETAVASRSVDGERTNVCLFFDLDGCKGQDQSLDDRR